MMKFNLGKFAATLLITLAFTNVAVSNDYGNKIDSFCEFNFENVHMPNRDSIFFERQSMRALARSLSSNILIRDEYGLGKDSEYRTPVLIETFQNPLGGPLPTNNPDIQVGNEVLYPQSNRGMRNYVYQSKVSLESLDSLGSLNQKVNELNEDIRLNFYPELGFSIVDGGLYDNKNWPLNFAVKDFVGDQNFITIEQAREILIETGMSDLHFNFSQDVMEHILPLEINDDLRIREVVLYLTEFRNELNGRETMYHISPLSGLNQEKTDRISWILISYSHHKTEAMQNAMTRRHNEQ